MKDHESSENNERHNSPRDRRERSDVVCRLVLFPDGRMIAVSSDESHPLGVSFWLNMQGYQCSTCREFHSGLPFSYSSPAPAPYFAIPEGERDDRVLLSFDQCVIDDEHFFILGRLEIPVLDADEDLFSWNAWVSLSEKNFNRATELWETAGREKEPPYFGWLSTSLPCYVVDTFLLKANIHTRPVGERPFIQLEPTDHPLAIEQRNGIGLKRIQEIAECALHG